MLKTYLKQAWELLKQNKLFSSLYIVGTGLSIAMTMVIAIVYYVRIAPVYPETNREYTLVVKTAQMTKEKNMQAAMLSYAMLKEWMYKLKSAELVTGVYNPWGNNSSYIQQSETEEEVPVQVKYADENFFGVFPLTFLEGKPFTEADRRSGIRNAVLTDSYVRQLFGTTQGVVGKVISLNYTDVKIVGIVRGGSYLTPDSYAQLYLPYSCLDGYDKKGRLWGIGAYRVYILSKGKDGLADVKTEVDELVRKYNAAGGDDGWKIDLVGQPEAHWRNTFRAFQNQNIDWTKVIGTFAGIAFVLLFVPALNLSGMISARMERRLPEMGVRKAFGANRGLLLKQVLWENLILSGLGALLGLVVAWIALVISGHNTFSLFESYPSGVPEGADASLGMDMLFAPTVFVVAVLFCLLLNVLSALIPAWQSLRRPITASLNEQK